MRKNMDLKELLTNRNWRNRNKKYLFELQKLLDLVDNIEDDTLKKMIINQILKYNETLTQISEEMFENIKTNL